MNRRHFLTALLAHVVAARRLLAANASRRLEDWIRNHDELAQHHSPRRLLDDVDGAQ